MTIIVINVLLDLRHEFSDTGKGATADRLLRNEIEPDFDLIQP